MRRSRDERSSPSTYSIERNVWPLVFPHVVHAADVRVRHLPRHARLGVQLRQARGITVDRLRQELQGDLLAELQIIRAINLSHAALAEAADDPVPVVEQRARLEAPVVDRVGGGEPAAGGDRL